MIMPPKPKFTLSAHQAFSIFRELGPEIIEMILTLVGSIVNPYPVDAIRADLELQQRINGTLYGWNQNPLKYEHELALYIHAMQDCQRLLGVPLYVDLPCFDLNGDKITTPEQFNQTFSYLLARGLKPELVTAWGFNETYNKGITTPERNNLYKMLEPYRDGKTLTLCVPNGGYNAIEELDVRPKYSLPDETLGETYRIQAHIYHAMYSPFNFAKGVRLIDHFMRRDPNSIFIGEASVFPKHLHVDHSHLAKLPQWHPLLIEAHLWLQKFLKNAFRMSSLHQIVGGLFWGLIASREHNEKRPHCLLPYLLNEGGEDFIEVQLAELWSTPKLWQAPGLL